MSIVWKNNSSAGCMITSNHCFFYIIVHSLSKILSIMLKKIWFYPLLMLKNKETKPLKATLFCVTAYQDNINGFFLSNRSSRVKKELKKDDGYHKSLWKSCTCTIFPFFVNYLSAHCRELFFATYKKSWPWCLQPWHYVKTDP